MDIYEQVDALVAQAQKVADTTEELRRRIELGERAAKRLPFHEKIEAMYLTRIEAAMKEIAKSEKDGTQVPRVRP